MASKNYPSPGRGVTLAGLARRLGGRRIEGDENLRIVGVATLEAGGPSQLGFVRGQPQAAALATSKLGAVIAPEGVACGARPVLRSANPSRDFARISALLHPRPRPPTGVHPRAFVAEDAELDATVSVGPLCSVGAGARIGPRSVLHAGATVADDVVIGADCLLHIGVLVCSGTRIGDRVILQPGCIIGGDGFGYEFDEQGRHEKVPQLGHVVLEDDVEVGAGAAIDRARLGATQIGRGVKIDNLVDIGHNVVIGEDAVLIAQSGVAGGAKLGARAFLMAQSGVGGQVELGDGTFVGARGGVIEDTAPGSRVWGFPALPERAWHRSQAVFARLAELLRRLRRLERHTGIGDEDGK